MNLDNFLIVSAILFSIGLYGALSKKNAITVLMSIELMFNAVNIMAVAMSRYVVPASLTGNPQEMTEEMLQFLLTGHIFTVFIITVSAAEVALGLAIVIAIYRNTQSIFITDMNQMNH